MIFEDKNLEWNNPWISEQALACARCGHATPADIEAVVGALNMLLAAYMVAIDVHSGDGVSYHDPLARHARLVLITLARRLNEKTQEVTP